MMSPKEVANNLPKAPNQLLEYYFRKGYSNNFGRRIKIAPEILSIFRHEINRRNAEGIYKFKNRLERRQLSFVRI